MKEEKIQRIEQKFKKSIKREMKKAHINNALHLIEGCANFLYATNICYVDEELESYIGELSSVFGSVEWGTISKETIIFYDNFGFDHRGLAEIYLKALVKNYRVVYLAKQKFEKNVPTLKKIVQDNGGNVYWLKHEQNDYIETIKEMYKCVADVAPEKFIFYSTPDDVCGVTLLSLIYSCTQVVQINLTDHAFWLGTKWIDLCIEFREYGGNISKEYRNIEKNKIAVLPYYPLINHEYEFMGFPFDKKPENKVIFSGGSLYKTLGDGNKYYKIVEYILEKDKDVIFWYAGGGDDRELNKLIRKFPSRVYHTAERKDLFQIIQNCYFYLSTYPVLGGLMLQIVAEAEKIPLTLRHSNVGDGILLNQDKLGIEFDTMEELLLEIDRLLSDEKYLKAKQKRMSGNVITEDDFSVRLISILNGECRKREFMHLNVDKLRDVYIENTNISVVSECIARREFIYMGIRYFPVYFGVGAFYRLFAKMKK